MGLRATIVWRLIVNADKFTSGRIVLSYQPVNKYFVERRSNFQHLSQLHKVELDLNTETEVALRVPHRGPYTHFDITQGINDPGVGRLTKYLFHLGNPFTYTLYASLEDIDLLGPTARNTVAYQGTLEIEEQKDKPISSKLNKLTSIAATLGAVPILTPICEPLAWASGVAAGVASAFGYSRPPTTTTPEVYIRREAAKLNQTDGTDYADPMAMTTTNTVKRTDQIGLTEADEMSMAYLHGIKTALFRRFWSINEPTGSRLLTFPLCPWAMKAQSEIGDALVFSPMAYTANVFQKYRGSIGITIDIAKTVFHTGRLLVVFEPMNPEGNVVIGPRVNTLQDTINCHRDIIDVRKGNSFTLKFPFTSTTPYLDCERQYGYVHIFVLNALVTNATSLPTFAAIGVKAFACEDMEFMGPSKPRYWPYLPTNGTTTATPVDDAQTLVYQSGLEVTDGLIVDKMIGSSTEPKATTIYAELCAGEQIKSLKQLAMRSKLVRGANAAGYNSAVDPFVADIIQDTDLAPSQEYQPMHDFYSYVSRLYAYSRGGVILTIHNTAGGRSIAVHATDDPVHPTQKVGGLGFDEWSMTHLIGPERTDRLYIPMYGKSYVRYNQSTLNEYQPLFSAGPNLTNDAGLSQMRFYVTNMDTGASEAGYKMWRSAADDTQFGGFAGVPYMVRTAQFRDLIGTGNVDFKANSFFFEQS
jgi:hypothetical protein